MWIGLLWIVGCYGLSIALLHICFGARLNKAGKATKVLLITKNNQNQIEWYIRSMFFFSRLRGRDLTATILDEGSTDETMQIIERLSYKHQMNVERSSPGDSLDEMLRKYSNDPVILVNLSNIDKTSMLPLFDQ